MTHVDRHLSDAELSALSVSSIGGQFGALYAEGLDVSGSSCVAPYVVFLVDGPNSGRSLVIESDWEDTPNDFLDYHLMHASIEERPRNIPWSAEPAEPGEFGWPHSSISLDSFMVVQRVEVFECHERSDTDSVAYDAAIIFQDTDGRELGIAVYESIRGGVECSLDAEFVAELKTRYTSRRILQHLV